ncbi:sterol carrier protein 2-like isoform X1 [Rhopilema esculentum]|uniref:sterol carrier protein 2-like isoform X1 n=1 Tax=Rhopilema esculentum TaxID=499914 RepID=UPI0031D86547
MANSSGNRVYVCGVGMTKFEKPGKREDFDYPQMALESGTEALNVSGLTYKDIQQAVVGYVYGESTCGQRALYELGLTGIPIYNVNNNCATGSSALILAKQLIQGGIADCVMAVGFEKMEKGSLGLKYNDRAVPVGKHIEVMSEVAELSASPMTAQIFGNAGREHMKKFGTSKLHFAKIAEKNHRHSVKNNLSQFTKEYTLDEILNSTSIHDPLTKLQCCPTSDGGAAAILCSEKFVKEKGLQDHAVEIIAMEMATDLPSTFAEKSCIKIAGYDMTRKAAESAFRTAAGLRPTDVDVIELHDCFSVNELLTYEALGLCPEGKGGELVDRGDNTYGGKYVINPSGGLISKGHPLGATGLAQCTELYNQLLGRCGDRQVPGAKVGLQHNLGLGGAVVVGLYKRGFVEPSFKSKLVLTSNPLADSNETKFKSHAVFEEVRKRLEMDGTALVKKLKAVYCFKLSDGPDGKTGTWYVDAKNGKGSVKFGDQDVKAGVTIKMKDEDCFLLMTGKLNPQTAFMKGKLKVSGNIGLALKLKELQPPKAKL